MNNYEQAGRLIALANSVIKAKADGDTDAVTSGAATERLVDLHAASIRQAADFCASKGTAAAFGWVEGAWYMQGNKAFNDVDGFNATWRAIRAELGEPVR